MKARAMATGAVIGRILAGNPNTIVFVIGLSVLCLSVAQWSRPLAGSIAGIALMAIAVKPFVGQKGE